jgi:hypothetical protein
MENQIYPIVKNVLENGYLYTVKTQEDGTIEYFNEIGQRHREDGPAIELTNGPKYYYQNGLLHRLDGPAIDFGNGLMVYYQNGQRHRLDGPAVMNSKGYEEYWVNGKITQG